MQVLTRKVNVKIFAPGREENTVTTVEENLDECTLCDLCMQACPDGVKVVKLYES
jgi:NAD-dependent dihydropyrimidine dehydrogenase PreA subunit